MILNATIIVQAFHFFIAYLLINTLILKPSVRIITAEQQQQFSHKQTIEQLKNAVADQIQKKNDRWKQLKNLFFEYTPPVLSITRAKPLRTELPQLPTITADQYEDLIKQLAETIVKKVHYGH